MRAIIGLAVSALMLQSCSPSATTPADQDPLGQYSLTSVNHSPLPYRLYDHPIGYMDILGRVITLNDDGTFSDRIHLEVRERSTTYDLPVPKEGMFTYAGPTVNLVYPDGHQLTAEVHDRTMMIPDGSMTFRLER